MNNLPLDQLFFTVGYVMYCFHLNEIIILNFFECAIHFF